MSQRERLNGYIDEVRRRLRMSAGARGAALVGLTALAATIVLTLVLNAYAFPEGGVAPARIALFAAIAVALCAGMAWPLWRLTRGRSVARAEAEFPELQQRLVTFVEKERAEDTDAGQNGLFLELLAADTLKVAEADGARPERLASGGKLLALVGVCLVCAGVLVWMVAARPGFMGYGASLLWTGPHTDVPPIYEIRVTPGDAAVRRNSDELVTAQVIGLDTAKVNLFARYASASKWEQVAMQAATDGAGYQFLFAGLPENVEYYVQAGAGASKHFKFRVVDLPQVKAMQVAYHYPKWTGMQTVSEEQAGDLRALEGTDAELTVTMSAPLKDGMLALDGGQVVKLSGGANNVYRGTIRMEKDGAYHVAATDEGQPVRLSEDYFISTSKANTPSIAIDRPGGDYRASPIEEVTVGVKAGADFGLTHVSLHYSVNGGADQTVSILKQPGAKDASGTATLSMEDFKVQPGDVVSVYATAKDNHAETKTDISFIQVDPFEREFSQSQQSGGGGGGGGGGQAQGQGDIARREKELIAATWKQVNAKGTSAQGGAAMGKTLSEAQATLKQQALALSARMQSRDLSQANDSFNSFDKDMQQAAAGMQPAADKLKAMQWQEAMPVEQKVLQALLRAEATFRQIQVAFGQKGGGGGGGGSAGRDLASLFDLEMDTQKNQYETAQTAATPAEQEAKKVDDALAKLDALAKRQEEFTQKQGNQAQNFEQRWQQEMLRREAEQLQREMEQMQGQQGQQSASGQQGQQSASGQQGQQGQQSASGQQGQAGQSRSGQASGSQQASRGSADGGADPRVSQALDRLRAANDAMGKAGAQAGAQQSADEARSAAERLREATDLLGGAQKQQASGKLDAMGREADRLAKEESAEADRVRKLAAAGEAMQAKTAAGSAANAADVAAAQKERQSLANERQGMSGDLEKLSTQMRDAARELAPTQPGASASLRDALSGMDQNDLTNLVQRTADWLRSGINPNSNGTEATIATGLKKLDDKVRQAQQAAGGVQNGRPGQDAGTETAALDRVDRLRSEIERMSAGGGQQGQQGQRSQGQQGQGQQGQQQRGQQSLQRGHGQGQGEQGQGQQQGRGQQGQQQGQGQAGGQGAQQGQGRGQGGQQGQGGGEGQQGGGNQSAQNGRGGQAGQRGGRQNQNPPTGGEVANGPLRGGGGSTSANLNVDTGGQTYGATRSGTPPPVARNPADVERFIQQGMGELNQLRGDAKGNALAQKDIDALEQEMQKLDPSKFAGDPEMVEALHAKVLTDVDKLELELQRSSNEPQAGQVRTAKAANVPAGYEDAVADYYRRLGKGQ